MSLQQISKQLQRDLKKNPKKAGMLALLALVAVWFWVPLFFGGDDKPKTPSIPASQAAVAAAPVAEEVKSNEPAPLPWREIEKLRESDARTQSIDIATTADLGRSPFADSKVIIEQQKKDEEAAKKALVQSLPPPAPKLQTPEELGLKLSSTITGGPRPTALINNTVYQDGDTVDVATGEPFKLVGVYPDHVLLERNRKTYELAIKTKDGFLFERIE